MTNLDRALEIITRGRNSHRQWASYLKDSNPSVHEQAHAAGSVEGHEEWVKDYDHLEAVLVGRLDPMGEWTP